MRALPWPLVTVGVLAAAVLVAGCDRAGPGPACKVDVDTPELRDLKASADIADCTAGKGDADLPDVELACLGGGTASSLSAIEGPAILNFWSSTCTPCRTEMPALQAFHEKYGDQVAVIGVDFLETYPGAALELADRSGVTYPSLVDACGDIQGTDLVIAGLPTFVFVKADGSVEVKPGGIESVAEMVELAQTNLDVTLTPPRGGRG